MSYRGLFPFLLGTTLAYAEPDLTALKTRLTVLESQVKNAEHYNPSASTASDLLLGGDLLYWQARENGIPYVIQIMNPLKFLENPQQLFTSHIRQLQYDWDFGARAHVGWSFKRDAWSVLCTWTHFNTKAGDSGYNNSSKRFDPIWANPAFTTLIDTAVQAKAQWHLFHNTLDLTLGRPFHISRYLILKPEVGVSAASIKQHFRLTYTRSLIPGQSRPVLTNDFLGVGLLAGLDMRFCFGGGWSLFNLTHMELYSGHFHIHRKETFLTDTLSPIQKTTDIKNNFRKNCPAFQMQVGIRWDKGLFQGKHSLAVKLAYDYQLFFSQNQFLRLVDNPPVQIITNQGDLSLSGGTFSLLFTF